MTRENCAHEIDRNEQQLFSDETAEVVPVDELEQLVAEFQRVRKDFADADTDYSDGVEEGARSAASRLQRVIENRAQSADRVARGDDA